MNNAYCNEVVPGMMSIPVKVWGRHTGAAPLLAVAYQNMTVVFVITCLRLRPGVGRLSSLGPKTTSPSVRLDAHAAQESPATATTADLSRKRCQVKYSIVHAEPPHTSRSPLTYSHI
jgi:hypothetical protein